MRKTKMEWRHQRELFQKRVGFLDNSDRYFGLVSVILFFIKNFF